MATGDAWRYIAQRMSGDGALGDFLDFDVPLMGAEPEEVLSGHNGLSGTITPEYLRLKGPDGKPILKEYHTALWAESPDGEVWGGIVTNSTFQGPNWQIECTDLTGMTVGLPYTEAKFWVDVDPMDLFREIWRYIQAQPGGNFGISIAGTTSPIRICNRLVQRVDYDTETDPSAALADEPVEVAPNRFLNNADWVDAAVEAMKVAGWSRPKVRAALDKWLGKTEAIQAGTWKQLTDEERKIRDRSIQKVGQPPFPPNGGNFVVTQVNGNVPATSIPEMDPRSDQSGENEGEKPLIYDVEPYKLNWYTNFDLSTDIDDLAAETPFDWFLTHRWEGEELRHHIRLGYPKLGRRLTEMRFVVGENITRIPQVQNDGSVYANEVLVLGAGEGSSQIMARSFRPDGGVRRVATISDPTLKTLEQAQRRAEAEIAARVNIENISEVILNDHEHAPMGSVSLGDEILVQGDLGWVDLEAWCRVIGRRLSPTTNTMTLTLLRSDRIV